MGRAEVLVPIAWPLLLACPELERLDLKGRGAGSQPVELNFVGRAQGKCESRRESEGGRRELGGLAQGSNGWVRRGDEKEGRTG